MKNIANASVALSLSLLLASGCTPFVGSSPGDDAGSNVGDDGDNPSGGDGDADGDIGDASAGDGDGDGSAGDGDGEVVGDGDGDSSAGDGDGSVGDGDGDVSMGDGDGDVSTGDGDGDSASGDGDGDVIAPTSGCGHAPPAAGTWTLMHAGITREYEVHLPSDYDPDVAYPLVFSFHGNTMNAASQRMLSRLHDIGDREGFITVYPEGSGTPQSFNAGVCCGLSAQNDVDDMGFVDAMLESLKSDLCIDDARIYSSGLSNGGFMSYRLACERSDVFAAIGAVAGVTGVYPCEPSRPVPVIHFHGTSDNVVPYTGNFGLDFMSVPSNMEAWSGRDGCTAGPSTYFEEGDVTCELWSSCEEGAEVRLCTIEGGGHQWPGGWTVPLLGNNTDDIDASEAIWSFFDAHPLP